MNKYFESRKSPRSGSELGYGLEPFVVTVQPNSFKFTMYLKSYLEHPEEMLEIINCLSNATEGDVVEIHINSGGGSVDSLDSLLFAISKTEAHVHGVASGTVASAATYVLLACDSFDISPNTNFLFHSVSFGSGGKSEDVVSYAKFVHEQSEKMMRTWYAHLFSDEEIDDIIKNKREFWMNAEEFVGRFDNRNKKLEQQTLDAEEEANRILDEYFSPPSDQQLKKLNKTQLIGLITGQFGFDNETGEVIELEEDDQ